MGDSVTGQAQEAANNALDAAQHLANSVVDVGEEGIGDILKTATGLADLATSIVKTLVEKTVG